MASAESKQPEKGGQGDKFSDCMQFLEETKPPSNLNQIQQDIANFVEANLSSDRPFVLITSGGTTVPLELNTVRFIDNFSTGTRGAASCEYFLKYNCNVIFLHRRGSICPFIRHIQYKTSRYFDLKFFQSLTRNKNKHQITINTNINDADNDNDSNDDVQQAFDLFDKSVKSDDGERRLLVLDYESVYEYFYYTIEVCKALNKVSNRCMLYMASAVSDFYIPFKQLATDKIQSSSGPLTLKLSNTPKMLGYFKHLCGDKCLLVSFKLETKDDTQFLFMKARKAIAKYGSDIVCSNILHSRRYQCWMVTAQKDSFLESKHSKFKELEEDIVVYLLQCMKERAEKVSLH